MLAFSPEWAASWAEALNASVEYREAAVHWEAPVALVLDDGVAGPRRAVLSGSASPAMALLSGKIRLAKGNLGQLLPYASAAKQLLHFAGQVPTRYSEG